MVVAMAVAREVAEKVVAAAGDDPQALREVRMVAGGTEAERAVEEMVGAREGARVEGAREEEREAGWAAVARAGAEEGEGPAGAVVPRWVGTGVAMDAEAMVEAGAVGSEEDVAPCLVGTDLAGAMVAVAMAGARAACQEAQAVSEAGAVRRRVEREEAMEAVVMAGAREARVAWREAVLAPGWVETETGAAAGPMEATAERQGAAVAPDWAETDSQTAEATAATDAKETAGREAAAGPAPVQMEETMVAVATADARVTKRCLQRVAGAREGPRPRPMARRRWSAVSEDSFQAR